jgi:4-hydroxybenzoate polyprenyltransferase
VKPRPAPGQQRAGQRRLAAYARLFDPAPVSVVMAAATVYGFVAARGAPPLGRLFPFLFSLLLTQFAIALHNHYCDRDLDAAARPWRALPRGLVTPRQLLIAAWALFAAGLTVALAIGLDVAALVALGTGAGFAYNAYFKRTPLSWLPYWVALPSLVLCIFAVVERSEPRLWLTYVVGLPLVLAVHLGDAQSDAELDAAQGTRGLAQRLGRRGTLLVCWVALALALALAVLFRPASGSPGPPYLAAAGLLVTLAVAGRRDDRRLFWLAVMGTAVTLGLGWVGDLAA